MTRVESVQSGLILLQQMKFAWIHSDAGEEILACVCSSTEGIRQGSMTILCLKKKCMLAPHSEMVIILAIWLNRRVI